MDTGAWELLYDSLLFTPGDSREMMKKSLSSAADVLIFDLEDAVVPDAKADARNAIRDILTAETDKEVCVRVNANDDGVLAADMKALVTEADAEPDAIVVPKVNRPVDIGSVGETLAEHDSDTDIFAIVETARGLQHVNNIAAEPRVDAIVFGAEDFAADLGADRTKEGTEILYAREKLITAAAAENVDVIDTVFTDISDTEALREDVELAIQLGFDGKAAIHPTQVAVINNEFTPPEDRIEWAKRVLDAVRESEDPSVLRVDDQMVDKPVIERAETIVARARAASIYDE